MGKNILSDVPISAVKSEPFPHIILHDALPSELCEELIAEFPSIDVVTKGLPAGNNKRFDYTISDIRKLGGVTPAWSAFLEAHASPEFLHDVFRLFGSHINQLYPSLAEKFGTLANMRPGIRYLDEYDTVDIVTDAHVSINTPITGAPSSVRTAHVDDPRKLYAALLYLRRPEDDSKGGNLVLYKYKPGVRPVFVRQQIKERFVEEVAQVPYAKNTFIIFLNSFDSVHGVTPRHPTPHPRTFVNFVGQCEHPLFDILSYQETGLPKLIRRLTGAFHRYIA